MFFSLIIPVYNRPGDLREVLEGLAAQTYSDFEVIVVESGSDVKSDQVVEDFRDRLNVRYPPPVTTVRAFPATMG